MENLPNRAERAKTTAMAKRRLTRRQAWRIQKVQQDRVARALKKRDQAEAQLDSATLGPEQQGRVIAHYGAQLEIESIDGPTPGLSSWNRPCCGRSASTIES